MLLGWPSVGMPLMVLLGLGVRDGATPVDTWMQRAQGGPLGWLLFFTDYRTAQALMVAGVVVALARRLWVLVPAVVLAPFLAAQATAILKPWFGRLKGDGLAYPSGHTTVMVVVLGMLILAAGSRRWLLWVAAAFAALGIIGQAVTYHYLTDTVGAVLLGTSLVCLTAVALRWAHRRTQRVLRRLRI